MILWAATAWADPMPGFAKSRSALRGYDCARYNLRDGADLYPGKIVARESRVADPDVEVVVCTERWMRPGLRESQDEAILMHLRETAESFAVTATAADPDAASRTWHVEVAHPSAAVSDKVAFSVKNALVAKGVPVSDRVPALTAADLSVLMHLPAIDAWAAACQRHALTGALPPGDVALTVVHLDPREASLHAGVCVDGHFAWLR